MRLRWLAIGLVALAGCVPAGSPPVAQENTRPGTTSWQSPELAEYARTQTAREQARREP